MSRLRSGWRPSLSCLKCLTFACTITLWCRRHSSGPTSSKHRLSYRFLLNYLFIFSSNASQCILPPLRTAFSYRNRSPWSNSLKLLITSRRWAFPRCTLRLSSRPGPEAPTATMCLTHCISTQRSAPRRSCQRLPNDSRNWTWAGCKTLWPNHMAYDPINPWIHNLLEKGPHSEYAAYFDVDWNHPDPRFRGKIMAPFLGSPLEVGAGGRAA